jgi:hypothetical protein
MTFLIISFVAIIIYNENKKINQKLKDFENENKKINQ